MKSLAMTLLTVSLSAPLVVSPACFAQTTQTAAPAATPAPITCPSPAPTVDPTKKTWKHGDAEYNDYTAAVNPATPPAQKVQLLTAFLQKYPDSDYFNEALQLKIQAQNAAGQTAQAVDTAATLLKSPTVDANAQLTGYTIISYFLPDLIQPNEPQLESKLDLITQAATCGGRALASLAKPAAATDAQFAQSKAQAQVVFDKALGFVALQHKNYPEAKTQLSKALQLNPNDPSAGVVYYRLGLAQLSDKPIDYKNGIFSLARAAVLVPQQAAFATYLKQVYVAYHGSEQGLDQVMAAAKAGPTPPANFNIQSKVDIENAQAQAAAAAEALRKANQLPPADSFPGLKARLLKPDLAEATWKQWKAQGAIELDGVVISSPTARSLNVAVGRDAIEDKKADVHVVLEGPHHVSPGSKVTITGLLSEYRTSPDFMITLAKGTVKIAR